MENELRKHLLSLCQAYCSGANYSMRTVGRLAAGDHRFFSGLTDGKSFLVRKYDEVVLWFREHWPAGVEWPEGIPDIAGASE